MIDNEFWLGSEASYYELKAELDRAANMTVRDSDYDLPNPVNFEVVNGIAIGTVSGPMLTKTSWVSRYLGFVTYQDIEEGLASLANDPGVHSIILDYDTPGGMAKGCKSCAEFIRTYAEKVKPVYSHTNAMAASGGVWLYSAGLYHTAEEDAQIGSVGVLLIHSEYTEMRKNAGITDRVFRSAPYKALGQPYEKLSEEAEKEIEESIKYVHDQFVKSISKLSDIDESKVANTIANGKLYRAKESVKHGLVDAILPLGKVVAKVSSQHKPAASTAAKKRK